MSYRVRKLVDEGGAGEISNLARGPEIINYVKRLLRTYTTDFYELEPLEVENVILNEKGRRGYVSGTFLVQRKFISDIQPLLGNITTIPVVGEHVMVQEIDGQFYYSHIINRKNSVNENSVPGVASEYIDGTKYGENFQRKKVKPIEIGEGCITFEGRFGQTLHFDGHDNTPKIKISTHVDESDGDFRKESIDNDDSSIYLTSLGMRDNFDGEQIEGKKVLIQSDGIFIKGREEVRIKASEELKINSPNLIVNKNETKLGSEDAEQFIIKGDNLKKFLEDMISDIDTAFRNSLIQIKPAAPDGGIAAVATFTTAMISLKSKLAVEAKRFLSKNVKTI